jgi:adenylate cyclase
LSAELVITGPEGAKVIPLATGSTWKIGRSPGCAVVLTHESVSRQHAMVQRTEAGEYYLIDLGSRNGTFRNDSRVSTPATLIDGDTITIGAQEMKFKCTSIDPETFEAEMTAGGATQGLYLRRLVTVLVIDIRGYTMLAQQIPQEVLCRLIGTWINSAGRVMEGYGAWSLKYIGDAVMAVWVHDDPSGSRNLITRILRALADFLDTIAGLQTQFDLERPLRVGAGISTGTAAVGNTGTRDYPDYTAIGNAVNAAFRIESCTRQIDFDLAVEPSTLERLESTDVRRLFTERVVQLKGYEEPHTVWATSFGSLREVLAILDANSPDPAATLPTPKSRYDAPNP